MSAGWIVGISGASGALLGVRLLVALKNLGLTSHLVISDAARATLAHETGLDIAQVQALATAAYPPSALDAPIASGSFRVQGMIVAPCSIKTLSAVANSYSDTLLARAADVTLKEGRPLALLVREAPLHPGHLRLMQQAAQAGAILFPPVPQFYARPQTIEEIADQIIGRVLKRVGVENTLYKVWES
jgi:4-hydroxy-3-polyprenylbenzoate decarboxylase